MLGNCSRLDCQMLCRVLIAIALSLTVAGSGCKSKTKDEAPIAPVVDKPDTAEPGSASVLGLPSKPSNAQELAVGLSSTSALTYKFAILEGLVTCDGAVWSEPRDGSQLISNDLGADGPKTLCIEATTQENERSKVSSFSHSWLKDATPPTIIAINPNGVGPYSRSSSSFVFAFSITDALNPLVTTLVSLTDGSKCLNLARTNFSAACPSYLSLTLGSDGSYQISVADSAFQNSKTYSVTAQATDASGNLRSDAAPLAFTWDATGPEPISTLSAMAEQQKINLTWSPVADGYSYVVTRRAWSPVSVLPPPGKDLGQGFSLGSENFVACVTAETSCVDRSLESFTWYHYQVIAYDEAGNRAASGPRASSQTSVEPAFRGLTRVYLSSPNRRVTAEWQRYIPTGASSSNLTYGLFLESSPGVQVFSNSVVNTIDAESMSFSDLGTNPNLYFSVRQWGSDQVQDNNTRELRLKLAAGIHHKLAASGRFLGQDALGQTFLSSAWAVAVDPFGNIVFGGAPGRINVKCKENSSAYYCKSRVLEKIYTFAGTDGSDDGEDSGLGSSTATGEPYGISFDSGGNMFVADATNFRIRVFCYNPLAVGFCNAKSLGFSYHLAGTGSSVDGLDDSVAKTSGIGIPFGVAVDAKGNVYIGDNTFRKIRVICFDAQSSPCSGRVTGNLYNLAGTGVAGDAADNLPALAANIGNVGALTIDGLGNLFFSDATNFRIRAYCNTTSGTNHFCSGKVAGNSYRVSGTGVTGDGASGILATSAAIGTVNGLAVSPAGNLFFADNSGAGNRLRALCFNSSADYSCIGMTANFSYRLSGTGASTDGASNSLGAAVAIGSPRGLARDAQGNMIFADPTNRRIRVHCVNAIAMTVCDGKLPDYHYHLAGVGAASLGWNLNSFLTPMGLPQGLAEDTQGNLYFSDATNFVARVICYNTEGPGFCSNKISGNSYIIAGNGVTGNAADNVLAIANSIGTITGVEVESGGNLLLADNTNRTVRLVCGSTTGLCVGRTLGHMYRLIGNTTAIDTADNVVAGTNGLGQVGDLALDAQGNIWLADSQYFRVRLYCRTTTGSCASRTAGNIYRLAGTGVTGNAADAVVGATSPFGAITAIDVDPWNNIILGDSTNFYVRVLCNNASGGYCESKATPTGRIYRALGTGVTGDSISDTSAATTAISLMNAVQSDDAGNIYVAESTNRRIRVLCVNSLSRFCNGLTVNNSYRMIGSGVAGDASSGTTGASARIDTPSRDSLLFTATGAHLIYAGGGTPVGIGSIRTFLAY